MKNSRRMAYKTDCNCNYYNPEHDAGYILNLEKEQNECMIDSCPIAMAYVPFQDWECVYDARTGLCRGTIFNSLDKPFMGRGCCK